MPRVGRPAPRRPLDAQDVRLPVEDRIDPPDEPIAVEDRHHEVAVLALRLRDVDLQPEAEPEQLLRPRAVVGQPVERRQQDRPRPERAIEDLRVGPPRPRAVDADATARPSRSSDQSARSQPGGLAPRTSSRSGWSARSRGRGAGRRGAAGPLLRATTVPSTGSRRSASPRAARPPPGDHHLAFAQRTSSIIPVFRPSSFHPPVRQPTERSSSALVAAVPRPGAARARTGGTRVLPEVATDVRRVASHLVLGSAHRGSVHAIPRQGG